MWHTAQYRRREFIQQALVMDDSLLVDRSGFIGDDARPGDGEAVGFDAQRLQEPDILLLSVVAIVSYISRVAFCTLPGV